MATATNGSEDAPHPATPPLDRDANPNRDGKREPAIIDATAEEVKIETAAEETGAEEARASSEPPPQTRGSRPRPLAPAPRRLLPWVAIALGGLALLVAGGLGTHLFVTTDGAIVDLRATSAALQAKTATLDQKNAAASDNAAPLAALDHRVAALEVSLASARSEAEKAVSLAQAPTAVPPPPVDLGPLTQRIGDLEARLQPLSGAVTDLQARLQPLAAAVATSKADVSAAQDNVRKAVSSSDAAALVVVAQSLLGTLDRGQPFAAEVAAAQALGADPARLAALQPLAGKGVPTAPALLESFAPLAVPILAGTPSKEPQGLLDRLERNASNLVRVRPVGATSGDDPTALVARIEDGLAHGDVAAAVAAWEQLPAAAKTATGDWASGARARLAADNAAHALLADSIDRLGRSKS